MKFLCDVHIPFQLVKYLISKNHLAMHVNQLSNKWFTPDSEIANYADKNDYVLITKDSDFRKSFILNKSPRKLIRFILGNTSNKELIAIFVRYESPILENLYKNCCYLEISATDLLVIHVE